MKLNPTPHETPPVTPGTAPDRAARFPQGSRRLEWLLGLVLASAIVLAYQPAWHAGFIWDDDDYIIKNKLLVAPDGLERIWFSLDSPSQYFPLTYTAFRVEHAWWGLNSTGYHWVNILLHAVNALLVWWLLRRLAVPGAWLGAAVWGLHPVQVETVAWVTELKNVLMGFFFLLTLLAWTRFVEPEAKRKRMFYALALIAYTLALTAKTTACTLPAALLLIPWMQRLRIDRQRVLAVIPFVVLGVGMGLVTVWWERFHVGTRGPVFSMSVMDRVLVASHALWFYAGKLFWPVNLTFSYPRWNISASNPAAYFWLFATAGLGAAVYRTRRHTGRGVEVAVLFFATTLSPLLGFIMLYTFLYTFVADHYQYVASLGLIGLVCASVTVALDRVPAKAFLLKPAFGVAMMLLLGTLTWRQCGMYASLETLWRTTIARNPGSWMAHFNLGSTLLARGEVDEAIAYYRQTLELKPDYAPADHGLGIARAQKGELDAAIADYQRALKIDPGYADAHNDLGNAWFRKGDVDAAMIQYQETLRLNPQNAEAQNNLAIALIQKGRMDEAITHFGLALQINPQNAEAQNNLGYLLLENGREDEAIKRFQLALEVQSDYPQAQNNLAWALATARQTSLRNGKQAVELAKEANRLTGGSNPNFLRTLAAAYAQAGQFPEAVETGRLAWQMALAHSDFTLAGKLQSELERYQKYQSGRALP
jgi:protein O-mannosyl-transferase